YSDLSAHADRAEGSQPAAVSGRDSPDLLRNQPGRSLPAHLHEGAGWLVREWGRVSDHSGSHWRAGFVTFAGLVGRSLWQRAGDALRGRNESAAAVGLALDAAP